MVAGFSELAQGKEFLVVEVRNVLQVLRIPFSFEIVRSIAA
jgi:hypothetical protein